MPTGKKYTEQWYTQLSTAESLIFHKLREYLFKNKYIDRDTKYSTLKFCALNTLYEFADEAIPDFTFEPEDLMDLIEKFDGLKKKYEKRLELYNSKEENPEVKQKNELKSKAT